MPAADGGDHCRGRSLRAACGQQRFDVGQRECAVAGNQIIAAARVIAQAAAFEYSDSEDEECLEVDIRNGE